MPFFRHPTFHLISMSPQKTFNINNDYAILFSLVNNDWKLILLKKSHSPKTSKMLYSCSLSVDHFLQEKSVISLKKIKKQHTHD